MLAKLRWKSLKGLGPLQIRYVKHSTRWFSDNLCKCLRHGKAPKTSLVLGWGFPNATRQYVKENSRLFKGRKSRVVVGDSGLSYKLSNHFSELAVLSSQTIMFVCYILLCGGVVVAVGVILALPWGVGVGLQWFLPKLEGRDKTALG